MDQPVGRLGCLGSWFDKVVVVVVAEVVLRFIAVVFCRGEEAWWKWRVGGWTNRRENLSPAGPDAVQQSDVRVSLTARVALSLDLTNQSRTYGNKIPG